ncbi:MAG: hypothetical protein JO218_17450, partial [Burkholderiales bacterium]|nr:hypothetical protein [Burkholderiales bacterium]
PDELQRFVDETKQLPTPEARASAALQWVQDNIRYFSVSLGESSHRPYSPALVAERRFGDCKDKTYLLITLLHALGIEAHPILLSAESPLLPQRILATPAIFDHVAVQARIGDAIYYLDGTRLEQHGQLDRIGPTLPGAYGLVVDPSTTALTELKNPALHELTLRELDETFTVPNLEGTGTLAATQTWHGTNAEYMRLAFGRLTPEQRRKQVMGHYERRYPGITLVDEPEVKDDPAQNTYSLTMHYKIPKLVTESHGTWTLHYFPSNLSGVLNVPEKVTRSFPLAEAEAPYAAHYHATINWPDNVRAAEDPQSRKLASDFFSLDTQHNFRGRIATVDIHFDMDKARIAAADVPRLVEDMKKLDNAITGTVNVGHDELRQAYAADASLQDILKDRMRTQVERVSTVLRAGKLTGEDLAEALCERADAESNLEQFDAARTDADEALRLAPVLARAWECHADQLAARGQFARAADEYGKALSLGTPPGDIYYRRGRARYYAGQLERAAEDFGKARAVAQSAGDDEDAGDSLYPALWESWTLQRLHQPLPPTLVDLAHAAPNDAWPRPALAMLTGSMTPEQLLSDVAKKPEDDRELTSVEAWFFVAQYRLAHDDKAGAKQAFEKVRKSGITMYEEYAAAAFELKALDGTLTAAKAR